MKVYTVGQFKQKFGYLDEFVAAEEDDIAFIFVSDKDICPYTGVEYKSGVIWVYWDFGAQEVVGGDELEYYLNQEED